MKAAIQGGRCTAPHAEPNTRVNNAHEAGSANFATHSQKTARASRSPSLLSAHSSVWSACSEGQITPVRLQKVETLNILSRVSGRVNILTVAAVVLKRPNRRFRL